MGCLGVHFALSDSDAKTLADYLERDDEGRREFVTEVVEERELGGRWSYESDKAWDAIHRCLGDGTLRPNAGVYPLGLAVLGGKSLYKGDDYIMWLKSPLEVREIASKLRTIDEAEFRARYRRIDPDDYGMPLDEEDESYTWEYFKGLVEFYIHAAPETRFVLFTADQ